jgi:hypothetical protein
MTKSGYKTSDRAQETRHTAGFRIFFYNLWAQQGVDQQKSGAYTLVCEHFEEVYTHLDSLKQMGSPAMLGNAVV